ncbi:AAA family ATPase [Pseudoxanthomonas sp. PXM03]|uniref:AAA family ATPase n=1 Tax=Pseudoxanthomonas sp. PXM03 TaxID=2769284 RepID=UPI00177AA52F|nr:AAA family ATPase [Pseudoxanthomonas sp. PXM03]MBD9437344.1 AAA family ATPase [Pseudoxanthomonas sp. PXM03]
MIKSISIQGYKSFHPTQAVTIPIAVDKQQPVFIYGLNGAGKTAIGEVIDGRASGDARFQHCKVEATQGGPFRYMVYNHHFVQRVIGEAEGMPGIFTLGELDTAVLREIEDKERQLGEIGAEREAITQDNLRLQPLIDTASKAALEEVWTVYQDHDGGTFDEFITGYGRGKQKFFDDLWRYRTDDTEVLDTLEVLAQRLSDVSGTEERKSTFQFSMGDLEPIGSDPVWKVPIEISGDSRLAPLIERLGNADWVGTGRPYMRDDQCPFCQEGLPADFTGELAKLLDGDRQTKIDGLQAKVDRYVAAAEVLEAQVKAAMDEPLSTQTSLKGAWHVVHVGLISNIVSMRAKLARPSDAVVIDALHLMPLRDALTALNARIETFNERILNREAERQAIKEMFWKVMCRDRAGAYKTYHTMLEPLTKRKSDNWTKEMAADIKQKELGARLTKLRQNQEGVGASVEAINARLKSLGIQSFSIALKDNESNLYRLQRPNNEGSDPHTLSEGEKTLISFLYFIELLKGASERGQRVVQGQTIVVIDDPISSLSHNYVYDIATIICAELIKPPGGRKVRQIIVLTHSLFFLHELVGQVAVRDLAKAANHCQLFRVVKGEHSKVVPLLARDFANDYDALWQVIRDAKDGNVPQQVVPNTMRCILETFFAFTGKTKQIEDILLEMSNADRTFVPLARYLNRGSHKDAVNQVGVDWSMFNLDYYLDKLEKVFVAAGHDEHFGMKMGQGDNQATAA